MITFIILAILLVAIVCVIVRAWMKYNSLSDEVLHKDNAVPCNVMNTTEPKQEKGLINEEDYINPTLKKLEGNNDDTLSVHNYETINENIYEDIS